MTRHVYSCGPQEREREREKKKKERTFSLQLLPHIHKDRNDLDAGSVVLKSAAFARQLPFGQTAWRCRGKVRAGGLQKNDTWTFQTQRPKQAGPLPWQGSSWLLGVPQQLMRLLEAGGLPELRFEGFGVEPKP